MRARNNQFHRCSGRSDIDACIGAIPWATGILDAAHIFNSRSTQNHDCLNGRLFCEGSDSFNWRGCSLLPGDAVSYGAMISTKLNLIRII